MQEAIIKPRPLHRRFLFLAFCVFDAIVLVAIGVLGPTIALFGLAGISVLVILSFSPIALIAIVFFTSYIASVPGIDPHVFVYGKLALIAGFLWLAILRFVIERKKFEAEFGNFEKAVMLFIIWVGIITVTAVRPIDSFRTLRHFIILFIIYYAALETISRRIHIWTIFYIVLVASIVTGLYSASHLLGGPIFRIVGFLGNANSLGILGFTTLSILLAATAMSRSRWEKSLFITGMLSSLFFLGFSWSRGSWLAACGMAAAYMWMERRRLLKLLVLMGIVAFMVVLLYEPFYSTFYNVGRIGSLTTRRDVYWQYGLKKALDRPIFGHGFNLLKGDVRSTERLSDIQEVTVFKTSSEHFYPHNLIVLLFLSTGLPGLIIFGFVYYYLFKRHRLWRKSATNRSRRILHTAILGLLVASIINSMFETGLFLGDEAYANYLWGFLGLAAAVEKKNIDI